MEQKNRILKWTRMIAFRTKTNTTRHARFFLLLGLAFCNLNLQAQLINIEGKRVLNNNGISGAVSFGGSWTESVSNVLILENQINIQYKHKAHLLMLFNDIDIIQVNNEDVANHGFQHLRYNYTFRDSSAYTLELFAQRQDDVVRKLERRLIAGGGIRFRLLETEKVYLYFAPLVMYEHEEYIDNINPDYNFFKLDAYFVFNVNINSKVKFNTITYYQPAFSDFQKFRIAHTSTLQVALFKHLSLRVSYILNQDNYPVADVPERFSRISNTIRYKF